MNSDGSRRSTHPSFRYIIPPFMTSTDPDLQQTYLPMFLPPPSIPGQGTGTEAPAAVPVA